MVSPFGSNMVKVMLRFDREVPSRVRTWMEALPALPAVKKVNSLSVGILWECERSQGRVRREAG